MEFTDSESGKSCVKSGAELCMYLLLHNSSCHRHFQMYCVEIMLRIYLLMMASNCTGLRTFSKLSIITDVPRSTMGLERHVVIDEHRI